MRSFSERGVPLEEHGLSRAINTTSGRDNARALFALTRQSSSPNVALTSRTRRVIEATMANFNPAKFAWFADEFTYPQGLPALCDRLPLVNLSEGLCGLSFAKTRTN